MKTPNDIKNLNSATQNEGSKKKRVSELRASINIEYALTELGSKNFKSSKQQNIIKSGLKLIKKDHFSPRIISIVILFDV